MLKKTIILSIAVIIAAQIAPTFAFATSNACQVIPSTSGGGSGGNGNPKMFGLTGAPGTSTNPVAHDNSCYKFNRSLFRGMSGDEITAVQLLLKEAGYFNGDPTGYFGPLTMNAIMKFQADNGLDPVGHVGPLTRNELNKRACTFFGVVSPSGHVTNRTSYNPAIVQAHINETLQQIAELQSGTSSATSLERSVKSAKLQLKAFILSKLNAWVLSN